MQSVNQRERLRELRREDWADDPGNPMEGIANGLAIAVVGLLVIIVTAQLWLWW